MRILVVTACALTVLAGGACDRSGPGLPAGLIAMFDGECPDGWSRYQPLDGRFPRGSELAGATGGAQEHTHAFDITARTSKDGTHHHMLGRGENIEVDKGAFGHVGIHKGYVQAFEEAGRDRTRVPRAQAVTDDDGGHDHLINVLGDAGPAASLPPYLELVFCRKD